jgi:hypothetical protein
MQHYYYAHLFDLEALPDIVISVCHLLNGQRTCITRDLRRLERGLAPGVAHS